MKNVYLNHLNLLLVSFQYNIQPTTIKSKQPTTIKSKREVVNMIYFKYCSSKDDIFLILLDW